MYSSAALLVRRNPCVLIPNHCHPLQGWVEWNSLPCSAFPPTLRPDPEMPAISFFFFFFKKDIKICLRSAQSRLHWHLTFSLQRPCHAKPHRTTSCHVTSRHVRSACSCTKQPRVRAMVCESNVLSTLAADVPVSGTPFICTQQVSSAGFLGPLTRLMLTI